MKTTTKKHRGKRKEDEIKSLWSAQQLLLRLL
jgi:hypothetical protein